MILKEYVYASVVVNAQDMYKAYAPVPGIISKLYVEEGDTVSKGQLLGSIQNENLILSTNEARLNLQLTENNALDIQDRLDQLLTEIDILSNQLQNDSSLYVRQKNLWDKNIGTRNELDQRRLIYENSKQRLEQLRSQFSLKKNQLTRELKLQEERAHILLMQRENNQMDYDIESKMEGRVYQVLKEEGEMLLNQEALFEIGHSDKFLVELDVDENDIARVKTGQLIYLLLDAYDDEVFQAEVSRIIPRMDARSQTFRVEAVFKNPPPTLYPGFTGEANILIQEIQNALVIPNEYLMDGRWAILDTGIVELKTGVQTIQFTEVLNGLKEGDRVFRPRKN
jgi:multidrug efflux pump subunit AcrA (membrane-fusion protein)